MSFSLALFVQCITRCTGNGFLDIGSLEESPRFTPSFQTSSFAAVFVEKASSVKHSAFAMLLAGYLSAFCASVSDPFGLELCSLGFMLSPQYNSHSGSFFGQVFSSGFL